MREYEAGTPSDPSKDDLALVIREIRENGASVLLKVLSIHIAAETNCKSIYVIGRFEIHMNF